MENLDYLDFCVEQEAEPLLHLSQEKGVGGFWPFRLVPMGKNTGFGNQGPAGAWNSHPRGAGPWNWAPCGSGGGTRETKNPRKSLERDGIKIILSFPTWGKANPHRALPSDTELSLEVTAPWAGGGAGLGKPDLPQEFLPLECRRAGPERFCLLILASKSLRESAPEGAGLARRIRDVIPFIPERGNLGEGV